MPKFSLKQTGPSSYVVETVHGQIRFGEGNPRPMDTVAAALAGCFAMAVSEILEAMRQKLGGIEIQLSLTERKELPSIFETVNIHLSLKGENLSHQKVERAINLAEETYCPVSVILRKSGAQTKTTFDIKT